MPKKLTISFTARGYELDSFNHINNAVYLNYFEHARWEFLREMGLYDLIMDNGIKLVVTDIHVRYQREIRIFDELKVESFCYPEKPYLVFQQRIINMTLNMPAARATTKVIFIGRDKIARDIPFEILQVI
jgi:YbgC/YbaW family acyl-CoA thioester hydrolase